MFLPVERIEFAIQHPSETCSMYQGCRSRGGQGRFIVQWGESSPHPRAAAPSWQPDILTSSDL
ncbi:hypothetical protein XENTR_v10006601 [Xenopus tropicalis]|nr:hypothetical protein XENTR_v10006601 [Xenopus tropicalis]KAE8626359.1 hypothetical protein XENTR_v10006601 [Xenopus tropicalis]